VDERSRRRPLPLLVFVVALVGVVVLGLAPYEIAPDTWLLLVAGREIATGGLPSHDHLVVLAHGGSWVDQQWLSQLLDYALVRVGGLKLVLLVFAAALTAAFGLSLAAARAAGASARSILVVALPCLIAAPWALQLRAQGLVLPLFTGLLWLLAAESRRPSARIALALLLLVLWANLHGSVVVGAALVVLYALTAFRRRRGLSVALLIAAPASILASPYALRLVGYYHGMVGDRLLARYNVEWQPTSWQNGKLFFVLALAAIWLIARHGTRLTLFELLAVVLLIVVALTAIRNVSLFAFALPALAPAALDDAWPAADTGVERSRLLTWLARAAVAALALTVIVVARRPQEWVLQQWPVRAADQVYATAAADAGARVFASDRYADWLLWRYPSLAGRVAYDSRVELLSERQLRALTENRAGAARDYRILLLDPHHDRALQTSVQTQPGVRAGVTSEAVVLVRPRR
jgi:hypothetical protein